MTARLLFFIVVAQAMFIIVTAIGLGVAHHVGLRRDVRRARELETAREVVRRYLDRGLLAEEARSHLEALSSATLARLVYELSDTRSGEDRDRAFGVIEDTSWQRGLPRLATSRLWWRRLRAARALATLARAEHLMVVHDLLDDEAPAVRLTAAAALERLPSPGLASAILDRAVVTRGAERNRLIEILASADTLVLPEMMRRLSASPDEETLRVLVDLAGGLGYTSLLPHVIRHASSDWLEVRIAVANCLRHYPHPETANALRRLLTDRDWQVRARAAASLGAISAVEAIPDLTIAMRDPNWWVRLRSAIALRLVGPLGVEALQHFDPTVDRYALDMARYVLELDDGAIAEYLGGETIGLGGAAGRAAVG